MSDITKANLMVAVQPVQTGPTITKAVMYVALTDTALVPTRKRVQGRIRYGDGN